MHKQERGLIMAATKKTGKGLGKGLGRGIGNLIPEETKDEKDVVVKEVVKEVVVKEPAEVKVRISQVEPNKEQPRKYFDEDALIELSESIKQYGVLQPLLVQKKDNYYEIIAGERRWRAAKLAGVKEIPVVIKDYSDQEEIMVYLSKILNKEAFDQTGLIYGMGHAVYSLSDPREKVLKSYVEQLANEKGREEDLMLYENVEKIAPQLIVQKRHIFKGVSPNVDFYSGFVYDMLGIPHELYTAIFAVARIVGWSAHRIEELICTDKIIRPAYMSVMEEK